MSEPLAYFITWTTYGTWLRGDERGWVESGKTGIQTPDPRRQEHQRGKMKGEPVLLNDAQRAIVHDTIVAHCEIRDWKLHAVNVRTNHVHVVVAAGVDPDTVMNQFKAWCSRRLNEHASSYSKSVGSASKEKCKWWTEHGSTKWINDVEYLRNAIRYVLEGQ